MTARLLTWCWVWVPLPSAPLRGNRSHHSPASLSLSVNVSVTCSSPVSNAQRPLYLTNFITDKTLWPLFEPTASTVHPSVLFLNQTSIIDPPRLILQFSRYQWKGFVLKVMSDNTSVEIWEETEITVVHLSGLNSRQFHSETHSLFLQANNQSCTIPAGPLGGALTLSQWINHGNKPTTYLIQRVWTCFRFYKTFTGTWVELHWENKLWGTRDN